MLSQSHPCDLFTVDYYLSLLSDTEVQEYIQQRLGQVRIPGEG